MNDWEIEFGENVNYDEAELGCNWSQDDLCEWIKKLLTKERHSMAKALRMEFNQWKHDWGKFEIEIGMDRESFRLGADFTLDVSKQIVGEIIDSYLKKQEGK